MSELEDLRAALDAAKVGVWWWDIPTDSIRWSEELFRLFECDPKAAPPSFAEYRELLHPDDRDSVQAALQEALASADRTGAPSSYFVEHRLNLADGSVRWIEGRGRVSVDAKGKPVGVSGTAVDVSARKFAEGQLLKSEQLHRLFGELASDYVYVVDYAQAALFPEIVGGSFERTTGMTPAEVQARGGWWEVIHPDDRAALAAVVPLAEQGKPSVNEYRITDGHGQVRWLRDAVHPVLDPASGKVLRLVGGVQDITQQKRLEAQLVQAQKLEAVARLSGGIAHDFNNLLSVILGSVGLLQMQAQSSDAKEFCGEIVTAATRGAELTASLLLFARRDGGSPELVSLLEVVRQAIPIMVRAVGPRVSLVLSEAAASPHVWIDRGQAQLMLLNLAVNARDAMPEGGRIWLDIAACVRAELPSELGPGPYVRLTVRDEGTGIAPETLKRLFEPFFTTKPQGRGTGLGLATCHGIAQLAGGAIQASSVVGQGATFTVYLPQAEGEAIQTDIRHARVSPGGTETVLLVEDEKPLQRIAARILTDRGYTVVSADSAEQALNLLEGRRFALLISDIVLPGMDGTALARQSRDRWPTMRVLLVSGHPGEASIPDGVPLLAKPFTAERLAAHVRSVLDA